MQLICAGRVLDLSRPVVMGVLNVTPDSFSDGGRFLDPHAAVAHAERMAAEGAAIIDVGGESTRPGAGGAPGGDEELRRVLPVVERIAGRLSAVLISVDTSSPELMRRAAASGAHMINDVRALQRPGALEATAQSNCGVCLMHMLGEPHSMQADPHYEDVVAEVKAFLRVRAEACIAAGIGRERLSVDPGFGFGKRLEHNRALLRELPRLESLGMPLTVGLSRKSMLATLLGRKGGDVAADRLAGSLALASIAVMQGARIVRAHDVAASVDAVRVASAIRYGS
jgi:dihydropteroate synthase